METLIISPGGRITLSDELLTHLGIERGDKISVDLQRGGGAILTGVKSGKKPGAARKLSAPRQA